MSTLLKDLYSPAFYDDFASMLENTLPAFEREVFLRQILSPQIESYELKQHMSHTAQKNGSLAKKVFKISEREIAAGEHLEIVKQHRFRPITRRVYYSGEHRDAITLNGQESDSFAFEQRVD